MRKSISTKMANYQLLILHRICWSIKWCINSWHYVLRITEFLQWFFTSTSVLDFSGNVKISFRALMQIWRSVSRLLLPLPSSWVKPRYESETSSQIPLLSFPGPSFDAAAVEVQCFDRHAQNTNFSIYKLEQKHCRKT